MTPDQPWLWWPWGGIWIFPMLLCLAMFLLLFLFSGRWGCRSPWRSVGGHQARYGDSESASEILNQRYARGEITKEALDQMKKDIAVQ